MSEMGYTDEELAALLAVQEAMEIDLPKYTVIDLVAADEQEAYSMVFEDELCPDCKAMPNNPRRSNDGLFGICTGTNFQYEIETLTQTEAEALMLTENWKSKEEEI